MGNWNFKLLVIDIDGVMTNGKKYYDKDSNVVMKQFCDRDFTAIKMFKKLGVNCIFLSGDTRINSAMANDRKVAFWNARGKDGTLDKSIFVEKFMYRFDIKQDEIAYVGDDMYDLPIIRKLETTFAPDDASFAIIPHVWRLCFTKGGNGVIAEILGMYLENNSNAMSVFQKLSFTESGDEVETKNLIDSNIGYAEGKYE